MARGASSTNAEEIQQVTDTGIDKTGYLGRLNDPEFQKEIGRQLHPIDIRRHEMFPGYHVFAASRDAIADALAPKIDALYPKYHVLFDPQTGDQNTSWALLLNLNEVLVGCDWDEWIAYAKHQRDNVVSYFANNNDELTVESKLETGQEIKLTK